MEPVDVEERTLRVLARLGGREAPLLGEGGEARVYDLGGDRVARVHRSGTRAEAVAARRDLLAELARDAHRVPFAIPRVLETVEIEGVQVSIEPRLPGRCMRDVLVERGGDSRASLLTAYLEAAGAIGRLRVSRPWLGDLCRRDAVREARFDAYLRRRAAASLERVAGAFAAVDGDSLGRALSHALPGDRSAAVVHLDAFPGNMLCEGDRITAVLDFGTVTLRGDPRLDPLAAAVYLEPPMTPAADASDRGVAREWLEARGLGEALVPARRWLAAFWSPAPEDSALHCWCRSVLLPGA